MPRRTSSPPPAIDMLRDIVTAANICVLVTRHDAFPFDARPMASQGVDDDGTLWFLSSSASDKNRDIARPARDASSGSSGGHYWTTEDGKIVAGVKMLLSAAGANVDDGGVQGQRI